MLELRNIVKDYIAGDTTVQALKGVSIAFRKSEFVSVLGPSGCGKTTLLNIVGGLDRYTEGDLVINGMSTKLFKGADWDAYRNRSVGFVFQNYNLIPHLTVLGNVELALTLSGVSPAERKRKAETALGKVGLEKQINKRPNQLSGGQMQRVAIARALVNDPDIILADEPTGALDSVTSVQIADLLKEISSERLVIMVTHNNDLAEKYSTRIVRLLDGEMVSDSDPYSRAQQDMDLARAKEAKALAEKAAAIPAQSEKKGREQKKKDKTSMSYFTALSLSFKNLITKKGRTFMTSFAGSIGIIGIALVLSVSNGFTKYIDRMQSDMLSGYPLQIDSIGMDLTTMPTFPSGDEKDKFPDNGALTPYEPQDMPLARINNITDDYINNYVNTLDSSLYNSLSYTRDVAMNAIRKNADGSYMQVNGKADSLVEMSGGSGKFGQELLQNGEFVQTQYDVMKGTYPAKADELALVVDQYNRISMEVLKALNIDYTVNQPISFENIIGTEFRIIPNNAYYQKVGSVFTSKLNIPGVDQQSVMAAMYAQGYSVKITAVMRINQDAALDLFQTGIMHTPALTDYVLELAKGSELTAAQAASQDKSVLTAVEFKDVSFDYMGGKVKISKELLRKTAMQIAGVSATASAIQVYPKNFECKEQIKQHLNGYNQGKASEDQIVITDASEMITSTMTKMVDIISYVLIAFSAVSLVVSSIMIGIITYVSVIERTKEIGVLRSIGARKKDITRVFNAETLIIGCVAGLIGVFVAFLLTFPINAIITHLVSGVGNMAVLNPLHALLMVVVSMLLTLIAGFIPSRMAAKKDPVIALRTE